MVFRRHATVSIVLAALTAAFSASAAPTITPKVLQCDGTYAAATSTRHPSPKVRADITDAIGLRFGKVRMGIPASTKEIWRFDSGTEHISGACNVTAWSDPPTNSIPSAWQIAYSYRYRDANTSDTMYLGDCLYNSLDTCATTSSLASGQLAGRPGSCPASETPSATWAAITLFTPSGHDTTFGSAADFNGVQFASITYNTTVGDPPATYTISAWIYPRDVAGNRIISQQTANGYWGLGIMAGKVRHLDSRDYIAAAGVGTNYNTDVASGSVTANAWHQIHVVRDNATTTRKFYVDGTLVGTAVAVSTDSFYPAHPIGAPIYIGATSAAGEGFNGLIDELRVVHSALTDDDIKLEYAGSHHQYTPDVVTTGYSDFYNTFSGPPANGVYSATDDPAADAPGNASRYRFKMQSTHTATTVSAPYGFTIDQSVPSTAGLGGTALTNQLSWSWGASPKVCEGPGQTVTYELVDAQTGTSVIGALTASPYVEPVVGANISRSRKIKVHDIWGWSALSASVTAYTLASVPTTLALTNISTGGVSVSWGANSNPSYTRYELTYSPDNFLATTSTRVAIANDFTSLATNITGLTTGTTYFLRVRAFNGQSSDFSGGSSTTFLTGSFVTRPAAPVLTGAALSQTSVIWNWTTPTGASRYNLHDVPTGSTMTTTAAVTYTSSTLTVNTRYDAEVEAYVPEPGYATPTPTAVGAHTRAAVYTLAAPPISPTVSTMYFSSGVFSWNANGNPAYTNYELSVSTGSNFQVVVATLGALGTSATVTNLLPGTSYYARVRAFNGDQIPTSFSVFAVTMTVNDLRVTISSAPASPYVTLAGLAGAWQFDEGSGLTTADGSGTDNTADFACTAALCASTPTFTSGPAGLGTAASFSGLDYGVVRTRNNFTAFTDDLTVEAWVYPQSVSQRDYAGLVAVGNKDSEDFALDIVSGRLRFLAKSVPTVKAAWAATTVTPGVWTHVVGVYDPVAATASLYLNGALAATVAGVPARSNSIQPLSIGNRRDATGVYAFPFYGQMDAVRVLHRAMTAAEVQSSYQGSFVSTVTPASPNNGVLVGLPPNAFTSPVRFYISADPATHPIKISYAALNDGLAALPAGLTLVPNSLVEVVPVVAGIPYTAALGSSATVSIPYADANSDNVVDGTMLPASEIRMYTLNTTVNRWEALASSVDPVNHRAVGLTPHFSLFALFAPSTIGSTLAGVRVYPVPWKPGSGGRFDSPGLTFDNLPASGSIHILTMTGERIADLRFDGHSAGLATWDGKTSQGRRAASGVFFAKIVSDAGGTMLVKFAIER